MIDGGQSGTRHGDGAAYCYTRTGFFQQIADVPLDLRRNIPHTFHQLLRQLIELKTIDIFHFKRNFPVD